MTFEELELRYGKLTPADWHQHKNGGAWIYKDARVLDAVTIGERAVVWGGTILGGTIWGGTIRGGIIWGGTILGGTILGGTIRDGIIWGGTIWGGTILGGTILGGTIEGGTIQGGTIRGGIILGGTILGGIIWGGTIWGGTIWGGTILGGTIFGGEWKTTPLFISGSRFSLSNAKPGYLQIGCECHEFSWWKKNGKALAKQNNFTLAEVKEYTAYVKLFIAIGK